MSLQLPRLSSLEDLILGVRQWSTLIWNTFAHRWAMREIRYTGNVCVLAPWEVASVDTTSADVELALTPESPNLCGSQVKVRIVNGANNVIISVSGNGKLNGTAGATVTVTAHQEFTCFGARGWYAG